MTMKNRILPTLAVTLALSFATAITAVPAFAAPLPAGAVATVNGVAIPQTQLDEAVHAVMQAGHQADTPQLRQALKQQLIARELFRQSAEKAGYGTRPEVQQATGEAKTNAEIQLYLKDNLHPEPVTDAQVKARYDAIVASLGTEEYKPRIIAVADAATAATVLAQLKAGQPFDALARRYSTAPNAAAGGELPWVSFKTPVTEGKTQGLPFAIAQAITQLPAGGITSQPIATGNGAQQAILKLDAKRPTQIPAFNDVKAALQQQLQTLALQRAGIQLAAGLLKNAKIEQ